MKYIDINTSIVEMQTYLQEKIYFLNKNEQITIIERPGEGNMNVVLRVKTTQRSFIVKQSRPYVEKFPTIKAPINRIEVENKFYSSMLKDNNFKYFPKILYYNFDEKLIIQMDLGNRMNMTSIYNSSLLIEEDFLELINALIVIHNSKAEKNYPKNRSLKKINHQHIFILPFIEKNGFLLNDIQSGLEVIADRVIKNKTLASKVIDVGNKYLEIGKNIIHGDFYPGSWIKSNGNLYVIDPEFSFIGRLEFDLGVMAAHLIIATSDISYIDKIEKQYPNTINVKLFHQFTGIEIIRRIIGIAQLPMVRTLLEKEKLVKFAEKIILN